MNALPGANARQRVRVAVVDDASEFGSDLVAALAGSSARRFEAAVCGRDASPAFTDTDVVLLVLDPEGDEGEVARFVQAHADVPVVVVGVPGDEDFAFEVLSAGAYGYLARADLSPRLLSTTLVTALQRHRAVLHLRRAQERALHLTTHDPVTRLGNRELFMDRVAQGVALARRNGRPLAVMVLDLSGLRPINETLGHDAGDRLLRETAERIASSVRATDAVTHAPGGADADQPISRLAGNEFTILLTEVAEARGAARVARRVLESFAPPFMIQGQENYARASIGIAVFPDDGDEGDTLVRNAHAAMHSAKLEGPNSFRFYAQSMNEDALRKLELERHLHGAIERGEVSVYYQPVRDATSGRLIAAEALLRWTSPELGVVGPGEFVPIAEDTGLIAPIGEWVLQKACEQAESWRRDGHDPIRLSVNLSLHQLQGGGLGDTVLRILDESGLSPGLLELEITESAFVQNEHAAKDMVREVREKGVGLALDDFGTGYSGLTHLRRFPIDRLKMDHSFTRQITRFPDDAALAAAVIAMAHSLRLRVVAEGVETEEQAALLRQSGCDEFQGYLFSPAVAPEDFVRFLSVEKTRH